MVPHSKNYIKGILCIMIKLGEKVGLFSFLAKWISCSHNICVFEQVFNFYFFYSSQEFVDLIWQIFVMEK